MFYLNVLLVILTASVLYYCDLQKKNQAHCSHKNIFLSFSAINIILSVGLFIAAYDAWEIRFADELGEDKSDHSYYILFLTSFLIVHSLLIAIRLLTSKPIRPQSKWGSRLTQLPLFFACASGWLALSNGAPYLETISITWLLLYFLTLALNYHVVAFSWSGYLRNKLDNISRFGLITSVLTWLLAARLVNEVTMAAWNADKFMIIISFFSLALFLTGMLTWIKTKAKILTILYLRRFGESDINTEIKRSLKKRKKGSMYRLVTLDDQKFVPSQSENKPVIVAGLAIVFLLLPSVLVLASIQLYFTELFGSAEGALYGQSIVMSVSLISIIALVCLLPTLALFLYSFLLSSFKRRERIRSNLDIDRVSERIVRDNGIVSRLKALRIPATTVVTTPHEIWQDTVLQFLTDSDLVILEASDLSEAVAWEIAQIKKGFSEKTIFFLNETKSDGTFEKKYSGEGFNTLRYNTTSEFNDLFLSSLDDVSLMISK